MINSGRFPGLEWLNEEKDIFRVPWIHPKKRGYCRERDAAIFREWAIHFGKYREDSDPTTLRINFRCAINGLKDIMEIKDMQQEDCRVYKVLPSHGRIRRRVRRGRSRHEPYPVSCTAPAYGGMSDGKECDLGIILKRKKTYFPDVIWWLIARSHPYKHLYVHVCVIRSSVL